MDFSDVFRPETLTVTITATGVPQKLSATSLKVKQLQATRYNNTGDALLGDANVQNQAALALNGGNQWIDLSSIYVSGSAGSKVALFFSRTFKA